MILSREFRDKFRNTVKNFLNEEEIWGLLPYSDMYLVSNKGNIKSIYNNKILKICKNKQGYNMINIKLNNGTRRCKMVHRLVLDTFLNHFDNSENIYEVNHIDGNKNNNNFSNLEWTTRAENLQHARDLKLFKSTKGEKNGNCKFNKNDIDRMKMLYYNKETITNIAKIFNANRNYINLILKGIKRNE